jgi:hypothetical protein
MMPVTSLVKTGRVVKLVDVSVKYESHKILNIPELSKITLSPTLTKPKSLALVQMTVPSF